MSKACSVKFQSVENLVTIIMVPGFSNKSKLTRFNVKRTKILKGRKIIFKKVEKKSQNGRKIVKCRTKQKLEKFSKGRTFCKTSKNKDRQIIKK